MTRFEIDRRKRGFSYWLASIMIAGLAIILPACAIQKASKTIEPKYIAIYLAAISAVTICAYWSDKKKAEKKSWRIPESTLHSLELAGGWFAAFFSQRIFRHKISKKKYQFVFWMIAVIHHYASFDYINDWHYTREAFKFIEQILK